MMRSRLRSTAAKKISFRVAMLICRGGSEGSLWNCLPALYWFLLVLGNVKGSGRAVLLCFAARRPRPGTETAATTDRQRCDGFPPDRASRDAGSILLWGEFK